MTGLKGSDEMSEDRVVSFEWPYHLFIGAGFGGMIGIMFILRDCFDQLVRIADALEKIVGAL